ncbi:hypothetical protein P3S67_010553 [Capsicum chacoense]
MGKKSALFFMSTKRRIERKTRMVQQEIGSNRVLGLHIIFKKNIEEWRKTQPTLEDGTMVQPSPAELNNMWTIVVGGPKNGRTYGTRDLQSLSSPSLFPNSTFTLQTMEEMEAMKMQIVELTQKCTTNYAKFAKFEKLEELVKKHIPQVFHDEKDNESDDN